MGWCGRRNSIRTVPLRPKWPLTNVVKETCIVYNFPIEIYSQIHSTKLGICDPTIQSKAICISNQIIILSAWVDRRMHLRKSITETTESRFRRNHCQNTVPTNIWRSVSRSGRSGLVLTHHIAVVCRDTADPE